MQWTGHLAEALHGPAGPGRSGCSGNPAATTLNEEKKNVVVFLLRLLYPPWPYNISILAAAWFAIAITLGAVVAQAVFRRGRVTYHR